MDVYIVTRIIVVIKFVKIIPSIIETPLSFMDNLQNLIKSPSEKLSAVGKHRNYYSSYKFLLKTNLECVRKDALIWKVFQLSNSNLRDLLVICSTLILIVSNWEGTNLCNKEIYHCDVLLTSATFHER